MLRLSALTERADECGLYGPVLPGDVFHQIMTDAFVVDADGNAAPLEGSLGKDINYILFHMSASFLIHITPAILH